MVARLMYKVRVTVGILFSYWYSKYENQEMSFGIPIL